MTKKFAELVIVRKTVTELVPSLTITEYTPDEGAVPVAVDRTGTAIWPFTSVVMEAAKNVTHPAGTPAEDVRDSRVLGLNPFTDRYEATVKAPVGANATPELTPPAPSVMVACGVIVKLEVALFPRLSVTDIVCVPAAKSGVAPATTNKNAAVPCSVTAGAAGTKVAIVLGVAVFPI